MIPILESRSLNENMHLLTVQAPDVVQSIQPGQFVILRAEEDGERIPLSACDWDLNTGALTLVFMVIGDTTRKLASLKAGQSLPTVAGPLGNALQIQKCGQVLLLGGCYGIGSLLPVARAQRAVGNAVVVVLEARTRRLFYWEEAWRSVADRLFWITRDGSSGYRGHVGQQLPRILQELQTPVDQVIINGCNYVLKRGCDVTRPLNIPTQVSLNTLMIDGTGMCGVCRVTIAGQRKFACVDGPYFDGQQVDWPELVQRRQTYLDEEGIPYQTSRAEPRPSTGGPHA